MALYWTTETCPLMFKIPHPRVSLTHAEGTEKAGICWVNHHFLKSPVEFFFPFHLFLLLSASFPPGINWKVVYKRLGKDYTSQVMIYHMVKGNPNEQNSHTSLKTSMWCQHFQGRETLCLRRLWEELRDPVHSFCGHTSMSHQGSSLISVFILLLMRVFANRSQHQPTRQTSVRLLYSLISPEAQVYIVYLGNLENGFM